LKNKGKQAKMSYLVSKGY